MTRASLNRTLRRAYIGLGLVLLLALLSRFADRLPGIAGTPIDRAAGDLYEYLKDMALVFVTVIAAYLANVFQKRSKFVESLEEEWRGIVRTKSALHAFCEKPNASGDDYIAAFCRISETIDNMRIVYRNVGETDAHVGLYPYAPLHDMRRALQSIDPRKHSSLADADRKLARDAILQSFYALRETFLEELDLKEPDNPLLISGGRRRKQPGATRRARKRQERQRTLQDAAPASRGDIDAFLAGLYRAEQGDAPRGDAVLGTARGA